MLISVVLRLSPVALASGGLAGEAEDVRTGERVAFRDAAELTRFCMRLLGAAVPGPREVHLDIPASPSRTDRRPGH